MANLIPRKLNIEHLGLKHLCIDVLERWRRVKSGATYPMKWKVTIPGEELGLEILPAFADQELITNRSTRVTYWEGAVQISGNFGKKPVKGARYVEMTGYTRGRSNFNSPISTS